MALPQFTGEEGICSLLEDEIGQVQGLNRWDTFLTAGSRTAHEFYRAWTTLQQEAEQCSTFLGKQLEGELAAPPHCDLVPGQALSVNYKNIPFTIDLIQSPQKVNSTLPRKSLLAR